MKIIISNRSDRPIYEQIKQQIRDAIFAGLLEAGDLLPSIRQLARDLQVSVITITRAYNDLEQEGFINNVQGKGCYVLPRNQELLREHARQKVEQGLGEAVDAAKAGGIPKAELMEMLDILCREEHYE
ncbi:MAG: GntR family transcriptional regulator [Oscillospiraceae bacterium]|nr:GntR family transcriptional regulator [Oscillospiraceae bacterium]MDD4368141.1 GntR family transcriptional regulator [Oscillospiraceae bacterium]